MTRKEISCGLALLAACVPAGNSTPSDSGPSPATTAAPQARPSANALTATFEDNFDRTPSAAASGPAIGLSPVRTDAAPLLGDARLVIVDAGRAIEPVATPASDLGPNWSQVNTSLWHIENGRMCVSGARNHGVWLNKVLPVNARIEFDAMTDTNDGDFKAEVWGDGRSAATSESYTNATSYLAIFGGWKNTFHVLARLNEHGSDRKEIKIDKTSDDPKEKPVARGQTYRVKVERSDGKTVRFFVDGIEYLSFADPSPLVGAGHDHFGFNAYWDHKVCYDNVRVTPISSM